MCTRMCMCEYTPRLNLKTARLDRAHRVPPIPFSRRRAGRTCTETARASRRPSHPFPGRASLSKRHGRAPDRALGVEPSGHMVQSSPLPACPLACRHRRRGRKASRGRPNPRRPCVSHFRFVNLSHFNDASPKFTSNPTLSLVPCR